ncbi:hypothetical protein GEV33_002940 [Tenebrio molitor]|uniref:Uncharacterized protein n=1 Tax=Tenebrio molitor TaxID=7067 RepID=A0A8J6HTW8_TENMO|nr:hypothetical protein GEV33_002940 [Tenebrio molitor]
MQTNVDSRQQIELHSYNALFTSGALASQLVEGNRTNPSPKSTELFISVFNIPNAKTPAAAAAASPIIPTPDRIQTG